MAVATQKIIIHADDQTGAAIASAIRNSKKLDTQLKKNTEGMRGMTRQGRAQMAQLGHQMQDIAVQFQMGMNPLMILGQQGSQVASIFGAKGALFGSIIAVASLVGTFFFASMMKGADAAGEYAENLIKAAGGVDKLNEAQRRIVMDDMRKKLRELNEELKEIQLQQSLADQSIFDFLKGRKFEGGDIGLITRFKALFTSAESLAQQAEKTKLSIDSLNDSIDEVAEVGSAQRALEALQGMPLVDNEKARKADEALNAIDRSTKELADRAKILAHEFELVNINFGQLAGNKIPMAKEGFTSLDLKVKDSQMTFRKLGEDVKYVGMSMDDVGVNSLSSLEDALLSVMDRTSSVADAFKSMARSILSDLMRLSIQRSITGPLFNAMFASTAPTIATASGYTTIGAGAPASAPGSVAHFEGGGFTGFGGRSGGVDGRGGFPAILHPNETVIDHTKGQGMGSVNVILNISTGVAQTVRAEIANLMPQIAEATKGAVLQARQQGGSYSKSLTGI